MGENVSFLELNFKLQIRTLTKSQHTFCRPYLLSLIYVEGGSLTDYFLGGKGKCQKRKNERSLVRSF